jgi:hypothetical protein
MAQREQLNLRLPPDWFDTLSVGAYLDGTTIPDLVRLLIGEKVAQLDDDPDVRQVREIRARRGAANEPDNVTRLERRK